MKRPTAGRRGEIALRLATAVPGGYALAGGSAAFLSLALSPLMGRAEAVLTATMLALVAWTVAVPLVFAAGSAWRAAAWVCGSAAGLWAAAVLLGRVG